MIIRVLDQNYFVQQTIPSEEGLVQYVCTNVSVDDGRLYKIVRIPVREVSAELIRYLAGLYKEGMFHELVQYGNEKEHFHVVMDCGPAKGRTLYERLQKDVIPLAERLSMGEHLLEYLIISSVPDWFAEMSMDSDHIVFTDALECAFDFNLEFLEDFEDADNRRMQMLLRDVIYELFAKELDKEKLPEIKDFLEKITQGEYPERMSLYQEYRKIAQKLAGVNESSLEPKSFLWRLWDGIKSIASHAEKYIGLIAYAVAIIYLIWSIWHMMQPTQQRDIYPAVGDEKILSGSRSGDEAVNEPVTDDVSKENTLS
ncbi:MAG: hypothetical protein IJI04_00825 [Lachnospiraceae bacterium]|nr:hypothetical protein [Lachnospiraceae bacterium]